MGWCVPVETEGTKGRDGGALQGKPLGQQTLERLIFNDKGKLPQGAEFGGGCLWSRAFSCKFSSSASSSCPPAPSCIPALQPSGSSHHAFQPEMCSCADSLGRRPSSALIRHATFSSCPSAWDGASINLRPTSRAVGSHIGAQILLLYPLNQSGWSIHFLCLTPTFPMEIGFVQSSADRHIFRVRQQEALVPAICAYSPLLA